MQIHADSQDWMVNLQFGWLTDLLLALDHPPLWVSLAEAEGSIVEGYPGVVPLDR